MSQPKLPPPRAPLPPQHASTPAPPLGTRNASGIAPRSAQAPLPPSIPPHAPLPSDFAQSVPPPAATQPATDTREVPVEPHRPPAQTLHTVRQAVETVAIPRLTIGVEREGGMAVQRTVVHDGDLCKIGSHASNDIVLRDPMVSRFHCRLVREDGAWRLRDSGSMNGTKLDGVRVRDADLFAEGLLQIGESTIRVRAGEPQKEDHVPMLPSFGALLGTALPMRRLFALLEKIAASDINTLIEGESGTGKELVATEIMQRSSRADKPFVVVDCGAISPSLVESELFGHVRGAFTGADRDRMGAFEAADNGTVFLDEIGELPLELQPKLLRALEAREIRRVGETRVRKINTRVISATNRDLEREVNKGRFREDLYFRLAVVSVRVPPLRERVEDMILLVRTFLQQLGVPEEERLFPAAVLSEMSKHDWPGNVRELRNYVERSVVFQSASPALRRGAGGPAGQQLSSGQTGIDLSVPFRLAKDGVIDSFERTYLSQLLEAAGNNMSKAARMAGMDRMYLHRLVQKHGLRGNRSAGSSDQHVAIRPSALGTTTGGHGKD